MIQLVPGFEGDDLARELREEYGLELGDGLEGWCEMVSRRAKQDAVLTDRSFFKGDIPKQPRPAHMIMTHPDSLMSKMSSSDFDWRYDLRSGRYRDSMSLFDEALWREYGPDSARAREDT